MGIFSKMRAGVADLKAIAEDPQHGRIAVPGSGEFALPKGRLKLTYHESKRAASERDVGHGDQMTTSGPVFPVPDGLAVTVTGPDGASVRLDKCSAVESDTFPSGAPYARHVFASAEIKTAGTYTVTASGSPGADAVEPQILVG